MDRTPPRIVITQRYFEDASVAYLDSHGYDVDTTDLPGGADKDGGHDDLVGWLKGSGWIVGHAQVTRDLLLELPDLRVVSRRGVGYDRVDVAAAEELGPVATIAAGSNTDTVADQAPRHDARGRLSAPRRPGHRGRRKLGYTRWNRASRTHLMSPAMAATAAVTGRITEVRSLEVVDA
jgi:phosphoglycerate dehydrogenase-like enzyme